LTITEKGAAGMGEHRQIRSAQHLEVRIPGASRPSRHALREDPHDRLAIPPESHASRAGADPATLSEMEPTVPPQGRHARQQVGTRTLVRPYVLTRGRTQGKRRLAIEALVSTRADGGWNVARLSGEFRSVRSFCRRPRSVAEVAATLSVPLGVVRVLLDDMAEQGLVTIHETKTNSDGRPAMGLLERVLHGLHQL
jgi:hypothetical protein